MDLETKSRQVFNKLDVSKTGKISLEDLHARLYGTTTQSENIRVPSEAVLKEMFRMVDQGTGTIDFPKFHKCYLFYDYFKSGYDMGFEAAQKGHVKSSELEFHEFWGLMAADEVLQV